MISSASRSRSSSGRKPIRPPAIALSVPWPSPVRAKEPCSSLRARSGAPPINPRARRPSRHAPAVCEDDGPTMTGPMMSSSDTMRLPGLSLPRRLLEHAAEIAPGVRRVHARDVLRRPGGDDGSAARAAFRAEIDDPVRRLDHVEVVLDDEHRVAAIDETMEHVEQDADVLEVEARRRLVEDVEGTARVALRELGRELDALSLTARERGRT